MQCTLSFGSNFHYISRAFYYHTHPWPESVEESESLSVRALGVGLETSSVEQEEPVRTEPDNHGDRQTEGGAEQHQHGRGQQGSVLACLRRSGSRHICYLQLPHKMVAARWERHNYLLVCAESTLCHSTAFPYHECSMSNRWKETLPRKSQLYHA